MKESANDPDLTHKRLVQLDAEHRALGERITVLEAQVSPQAESLFKTQSSGAIQNSGAMLEIRRLKKQKLVLKDQITQLKAYLTPDIIA